ncbi:MAG: hypothetical protein GY810_12170 [Aureispira sp.]|nr:hypothetical protein [Aureispira sp.]
MYKSKLIQTLRVLDSQEKEYLKKWIISPAHNQHKETTKLFIYLLSKRKLTPFTCNKQHVFEQLYPKQKLNNAQLRYIMGLAVHCLEEFIGFSSQKKSPLPLNKALIQFYRKHKLDKFAEQHIQKTKKIQKKNPLQNSEYFYHQYQLEQEVFEQQGTDTRIRSTNLQAIFNNHYIAFILETLRHACTAITHQNLYNSTYDIPLLSEVLNSAKSTIYKDIPAVQLYYHSYMALANPTKEIHFQVLKSLLLRHNNTLPNNEIKSIYVIAINYCVRRLNTGVEEYVQAVFELYKYGLDYNILIEAGQLSRFAYKNIATAAIRLKEYDWVNKFIQQYTPLLKDLYQENYARYVKAKLLFSQGNYAATMELLSHVEFDDLFLNTGAKMILIKIYYEQQSFEVLESLLDSFRRFLQRKSIIAYQKQIYENTIHLTEKLVNLNIYDKVAKAALLEEIETTNPLTERPWLLTQLNKIK